MFFKQIRVSDKVPSKCREYMKVKHNYCLEKYLLKLNCNYRKSMARLRTSCHNLPIEIGRRFKVDKTKRYCFLCKEKQIGNEFHAMFKCKMFDDERKKYLDKLGSINEQFKNLSLDQIYLFTIMCSDDNIMIHIGHFIHKIFEKVDKIPILDDNCALKEWFKAH